MRTVDIRGSAGKGGHIPPELGGNVGEFEIFIKQGRAEDVVKVWLGFGAVGDGVIRGGRSKMRGNGERFGGLGHW